MPPLPKPLRRKIRKQVRKEFNPAFKDLSKQRQKVSRQRSKEVSSIQGATAMGLDAIQGALGRVPGGVGGRIENQLTNELQAMRGDVRMGGRQQVIAANQAFREGRSAVRQDTRALRAEQHDAIGTAIEGVKEARVDRRVERQDLEDERRMASREARQLVAQIPPEERGVLADKATWNRLEDQVAGKEGVSPEVAREVIQALRRRLMPSIRTGNAIGTVGATIGGNPIQAVGSTIAGAFRR